MKKRLFLVFIIICILLCLTSLSGCLGLLNAISESNFEYNGMHFSSRSVTERSPEEFKSYNEYYAAGDLNDKTAQTYFIPAYVKGKPVLELGDVSSFMSGIYISAPKLAVLYIPDTVLVIDRPGDVYVEKHADNFKAFYCGAVVNLAELARFSENDKCYVPAEKFEEFTNAWITKPHNTNQGSADVNLFKANIKYRLNADHMNEYYYVDYVESGTHIVNIPPEPERDGYKFDGWHIEKECFTQWNFNSIPILTATEYNPDGEFNLYAKWTKK